MADQVRGTLLGWQRLSHQERWATLEMAWLVASVTLALRVFGFRRTCRLLQIAANWRASGTGIAHDVVHRHVRAMLRVKIHAAWAGRCLSRALALRYALALRGVPTQVHLGVSGLMPFNAHAWVVADGMALGETGDLHNRFRAWFVVD
jgi:hypothetical protein